MKLDDPRIKLNKKVGYCYYIGNQRYLLEKFECPECKNIFLNRPYKTRGIKPKFCSRSCKAKQKCPNRQYDKHWNWKGGKYKDKNGYIRVLKEGKYILEHVFILEEYMGRKLYDDEIVHHLNGIRDDNRVENLELWSSGHPKGQRIEDKVRWAREILKRYN